MNRWRVGLDPTARKEFHKLSRQDQKQVSRFIDEKLAVAENPRRIGHALKGQFAGL